MRARICRSASPCSYKKLKSIDLSKVIEDSDFTDLKQQVACSGGSCEIL